MIHKQSTKYISGSVMQVEMNQEMLKVLRGMHVLEGGPSIHVLEGSPGMRVLEGGASLLDGRRQPALTATLTLPGLIQQHGDNSMDGSSLMGRESGSGGTISPTSACVNSSAILGVGNSNPAGPPSGYLCGLLQEKQTLKDTEGCDLTKRLLGQEIERLQACGKSLLVRSEDRRLSDVTKDKAVKLSIRVLVPVRDHPKFNFVGKLLGPRGMSLKRLQEDTMTKMAILGRGSMKDKQKEEDLRQTGDPKFLHLQDDLHVEITAVAPPAEAHARLAYALTELRRYLVPDYNDDIRQQQMREIKIMNGKVTNITTGQTINTQSHNLLNGTNNHSHSSGSDDGSCSPKSCTSPPPPHGMIPAMNGSGMGMQRMRGGGGPMLLPTPHPALRGLNVKQQQNMTANGGKESSVSRSLAGFHNSRRSVLSLLSRARAIQQKEQELMDVYHDLPGPGYGLYDHMNETPLADSAAEEVPGRLGMGLLKASSPVDRSRFRHDPYRLPQSM